MSGLGDPSSGLLLGGTNSDAILGGLDLDQLRNQLSDERFVAAAFNQQQQMQEEQFLKANIEYENRLKEHLYQFEDGHNKQSTISGSAGATGGLGASATKSQH